MKISQLAKAAQVPKETIHFYIRQGILPKPRKQGRNVADYDESYIERIRTIKELQDKHFLPLSEIKKIMKQLKKDASLDSTLLQLQTEYFRAVDRLRPGEVVGETQFRKTTGLGRYWLAKVEEWGLITPTERDGKKIYSQDDVVLGKVIFDMDRIGLGPKDGFDPESLRHYREEFRKLVVMGFNYFNQATAERVKDEEYQVLREQALEIMSIFYYHLYRKLSREEAQRREP